MEFDEKVKHFGGAAVIRVGNAPALGYRVMAAFLICVGLKFQPIQSGNAMGGKPLCALNIVCFPAKTMRTPVLREILRGGLLISLPPADAETLLSRLHQAGITQAADIGVVVPSPREKIVVEN
jgi:hypothetical protein